MFAENGLTLKKNNVVTRLGKGVNDYPFLLTSSMQKTVEAIKLFHAQAKEYGAEKVYIFATAAVRSAQNKQEFIDLVKKETGLTVDVISGEQEAKLGLLGALNGKNGGIIDVGGASSEVTVAIADKIIYSYSLNLGSVRILDACGQDKESIKNLCKKAVQEYGQVPMANFYGIGGTATTLASIAQELEPYDPTKVHGYILTKEKVFSLAESLNAKTVEERKKVLGLQPERAEVISGGAYLIYYIMDYLNIESITVSESDNLEGYLQVKEGNNE
jgi:exopolyphosphatase/guanosine-5'-triphosphate,3'-diphosphate pyrophosphatase